MTPAARASAAITVLDTILSGRAAEQALSGWARGARYAGSKDRAAVRDLVFQALRCKRSYAALGGTISGRGLLLGMARDQALDPDSFFSGDKYAPAALSAAERSSGALPQGLEWCDLPDWVWLKFCAALGDESAANAAGLLRKRAPVTLRVNTRKGSRERAKSLLESDGVTSKQVESVATALMVTDGARKISQTAAFEQGMVELQDSSSQAAMLTLPVAQGCRVLDYCAGGGGKVLALAAHCEATCFAYDADPKRMKDLPARAARAGARVSTLTTDRVLEIAPFDLVLCDVPCSGSGTWRRTPDAKWRLTPAMLGSYIATQREILAQAKELVVADGVLAFATCSVFLEENEAQISWFLNENPGWCCSFQKRWPVSEIGDGFFLAVLSAHA